MSRDRRLLACALVLLTAVPALAQNRRSDKWVATWAPALVSRAAPGAGAPAARGQGAAPPAPGIQAPAAAPTQTPAPPAPAQAPAPPQAAPAAPGGAAAGRAAGPGGGGGRGGGRGGPPVTINNQTVRQILHTTLGGDRVRVVFSNAFGTAPVQVGAVHAALRECADGAAGCVRSSDTAIMAPARPVMVNGRTSFAILPGATVVSDPIDLKVPALADLVVDMYLPAAEPAAATSPLTWHAGSSQTSYVSAEGNVSGSASFEAVAQPASWFLIARVEVAGPQNAGVVAAFGDSITDGAVSTVNTNNRWPDHLARRLAARKGGRPMAVVNLGISGNRLLGDGAGVSALARFDRDVLMQTGVTHVIVLEGINDIGGARANPTPSAEDLINAHRQMIARAHARGLTVIGATLTPFEGAAYYTVEGEAKRKALNDWIRTSGEYDAVIDFDRITRDPANPLRFLPLYDSGDHLHPGDAGYKAMGEAVDLALFK